MSELPLLQNSVAAVAVVVAGKELEAMLVVAVFADPAINDSQMTVNALYTFDL